MANVQPEDGCLSIAISLVTAICLADFSGLQLRIMLVIMNLTYAAGKKKAPMTVDDIRFQLGGVPILRYERVEKALDELVDMNVVFAQERDGETLYGIQKNFDEWMSRAQLEKVYKMSRYTSIYSINTKNLVYDDKMSIPQILLKYVLKQKPLKLNPGQLNSEKANARRLYAAAVAHAHSTKEGLELTRDFVDYLLGQTWVKANVKMLFTYALPRFHEWAKQVPKKPTRVKDDEQMMGKRFRYNIDLKRWEVASGKD